METASIVASFVSLFVSALAIWLAIYFYTQGKNTEASVQIALEGIRAQTNALQALNARTLDRLTKYVTTPRNEPSQSAQLLADTLRDLPNIVLSLKIPQPQPDNDALRREIIHAYIALWNYTATSNVWSSFCLPPIEEFNENKPYHALVKHIIDRSAADFNYMTGIINQVPNSEITASSYFYMYDEVLKYLIELVGDTTQQFANRARNQSQDV